MAHNEVWVALDFLYKISLIPFPLQDKFFIIEKKCMIYIYIEQQKNENVLDIHIGYIHLLHSEISHLHLK